MSLLSGIISGAIQGAGDAGQQVAAQQAKVWNQEAINQQMADLDVQKQASLMALQFQQKQRAMNSLYPDAGAAVTPVGASPSSPPAGSPATPTAAPPSPVANYADHPGFDPSQHSPEALSAMQKSDPVAYANGLNDFLQWQKANPQSQGSPIATPAAASSPQQSAPPVVWKPSRELASAAMSADIISPGAGAKLLEANAPDATGKMLLQMGILPDSPAWHAGYTAHQFKENSENVRPGGIVMSGGKPVFAAPSNGVITNFDANGNPSAALEQGYAGAAGAVKAAELAATNTQNLAPVAQSPVDSSGRVIPVSIAGALSNGASGSGAGLAPGQAPAADAAQKELSDKWTALNSQNQNAQSTVSLLQNIKTQAQKAAVGPASDRIDFANGLLSLVGNEKATDAVTANDLLDKYSNQIVAKLGQGGLGTDAGRAIVAAGNPNSHMNLPAINEAVDNLVGATQQAQAKAQIMSQYAAKRDPVGYQNAELAFDKVADPRIFQWKNIQNPQQQALFMQNLAKQDPSIMKKISSLQDMGALQ